MSIADYRKRRVEVLLEITELENKEEAEGLNALESIRLSALRFELRLLNSLIKDKEE